jgi:hypothetical protein
MERAVSPERTSATEPEQPRSKRTHSSSDYQLPIVGLRVPKRVGDAAFWVGATGAVIGGLVELPVAALVVAGVAVSRHHAQAR